MKRTLYLITGLLTLVLASCGGGGDDDFFMDDLFESSYTVYIDNSLDTTAFVTITSEGDSTGAMEYEVVSYGMESVELKEQTYHIVAKTATDSVFLDEDFTIDGSGYSYNLNLSKSDYIVENVVYAVGETADLYMLNKSFTYDGKTYDEVDARVIPGTLLVPSSWDYNIDDELPEEVTIYGDQNSTTKTKLYRAETFVLYLELYDLFEGMDFSDEDGDYGDYEDDYEDY